MILHGDLNIELEFRKKRSGVFFHMLTVWVNISVKNKHEKTIKRFIFNI